MTWYVKHIYASPNSNVSEAILLRLYNNSKHCIEYVIKTPIKYFIKSPQYTGGDFMFLYRFVRRRRPQIFIHAITFEQLFEFLLFLARLLALICRLPDWMLVDFRRDLHLDFFKVKYKICYISAKNGPIATKLKANISIEL